nr:Tn3 family transposase [Kitasatospora kifunensis]
MELHRGRATTGRGGDRPVRAGHHRGRRRAQLDAAVAQLTAEGHEIRDEDIARLSPLKHRNLNLLGRYSFTASTPAAGALRPLRDPDAPELDEDDDGGQE